MARHDHDADDECTTDTGGSGRLALVAVVNLLGFVGELAGGVLFGSVALISDAVHMLFDALAYAMAFGASYTAETFEGGEEWSFGLHRLEPASAFVNGVLLVPMVGAILWESYQRFLDPVRIDPTMTLLVALGGLLVNLGSVYVLRGGEMSLNERGAFYHLLGDAGGSVAVVVSTVAVSVFDVPVADPIAAVLIGALVLWSAGRVLRESASILLEQSPVPLDELERDLAGIDGVASVDDVHVWRVCSQLTVATVRLRDTATSLDEQRTIRARVHDYFAERGVDHATVELVGASDAGADAESADRTRHAH